MKEAVPLPEEVSVFPTSTPIAGAAAGLDAVVKELTTMEG